MASQTADFISASTPRKMKQRKSIQELQKLADANIRRLDEKITMSDVETFIDENYSEESSKFLKSQFCLLNKTSKGSRYTDNFKQFSLSVYFLGPTAYKQFSKVYRLPTVRTLNRFTRPWQINPGFNDFVFKIMQLRVEHFDSNAKNCIVCLDEISLKCNLFYDISKDTIIGFEEGVDYRQANLVGSALVLMVRGISSQWKQPVAYFLYKTSPKSQEVKNILFETIRKLNSTGLNVLGVVSDQGSNFYNLVKTVLNLTPDNPCFSVDNKEIVYIFDVPHLLKSTRNNFFQHKFLSSAGVTSKQYLQKIYDIDETKNIRLMPKLTNAHIFPSAFQKMKVKLAAQVFSWSVTTAMSAYIDFNILPESATATVNFIKNMNSLFDILNSASLLNIAVFKGTEEQVLFLNQMAEHFKTLRVENVQGKDITKQMKFLFGRQLTIKSVLILFEKLKTNNYTFLMTRNLNQDCLENFFGQIRNCCGN